MSKPIEDRVDLRLTRPDARKLAAMARLDGRTKPEMLRTLIRRAHDALPTPSDGLTRGETGANVPTTTRGE